MTKASSVPSSSTAPGVLLRELDGPAFAEPWMAQVFACAVHLSRQGLFTWNEWVDVFSAEIKAHPQQPGEAANAAYYRQWLAALETIVGLRGLDDRNHRAPGNLAPGLFQHAARSAGRTASR